MINRFLISFGYLYALTKTIDYEKKLLTLCCVGALLGAFLVSCEKQAPDVKTYPIVPDAAVAAFFKEQLMDLHDSELWPWGQVLHPDRTVYWFAGDDDGRPKDTCLVINSVDDLRSRIPESVELPAIDFEKYTLIVGANVENNLGQRLCGHSIDTTVQPMELNLVVRKPGPNSVVLPTFSVEYYWGLYSKLPSDQIVVKCVYNYY